MDVDVHNMSILDQVKDENVADVDEVNYENIGEDTVVKGVSRH